MNIIPARHFFEVTQTRKVRVQAATPLDAAIVAEEAFVKGPYDQEVISSDRGRIINEIRQMELKVQKDERI